MAQKRKATKRQESPAQLQDKKSNKLKGANKASKKAAKKKKISVARVSKKSSAKTVRRTALQGSSPSSRASMPQSTQQEQLKGKAQGKSQRQGKQKLKKPLIFRIFIGILLTGLSGFLAIVILSLTPLFTIEHTDYIASAHLTSEDVKNLVNIPQGTTLLSVNPFVLNSEVRRNPWVESAVLKRIYPSTLEVSVKEKDILALIETASSETAWYIGSDERWIEPASLPTGGNTDNAAAILNLAVSEHTLLIKDVPDTVMPKAGAQVGDAEILGALKIQSSFSDALSDQIAVYSVPNESSYTATLTNGVTVALGDDSDLSSKEAVILKLLETYPNQLTYINVKTPSKPTFRKIAGAATAQGTGVASK